MTEGKRTRLIKTLYNDEIRSYVYEVYIGSDTVPHIRTFAILDDEFDTKIKMEELGQKDQRIIDELREKGYKEIYKEPELLLKKSA